MKYVLFYDSGDDVAAKAPLHAVAHRQRWSTYQESGDLLLIGPFTDRGGAMAVFRTAEAAVAFAEGDPFVTQGVVRAWHIREWAEALSEEAE